MLTAISKTHVLGACATVAVLAALLTVAAVTVTAGSASSPQHQAHGGAPSGPPIEALDTDGDGTVSLDELSSFTGGRSPPRDFFDFFAGDDGVLDEEELAAIFASEPPPSGSGGGGAGGHGPPFEAFDADGDGEVDMHELKQYYYPDEAPPEDFVAVYAGDDGVLSRDEFAAMFEAAGSGSGGPPFELMDGNADGYVSLDELKQVMGDAAPPEDVFTGYAGDDGQLSAEEFAAMWTIRDGGGHHHGPSFEAFDTNADGAVDLDEFKQYFPPDYPRMSDERFAAIAGDDGVVSPDDFASLFSSRPSPEPSPTPEPYLE